MSRSTELEVHDALNAVVRLPGGALDPGLRLREDLNIGSLALVSMAMDLCDRLGMDPATLDLGAFVDGINTLGDLIGIAEELRPAQDA